MKKSNKLNIAKSFGVFAGIFAFGLMFPSCEQLQDSLSSEQLVDQEEGVGSLSAASSICYYNGVAATNVKGTESHLVLDLSQLADATSASVKYELSYSMDDVDYTSSGSVNGTLSDSKSKYYVDLSPAINLLDGTESPAYGDISYKITVSGLKNDSGNDYDGRTMPTFSKKITFAPLYGDEAIEFSTKPAPAQTEFSIPLNGTITAVDETVEVTASSGTLPTTTFTASVSSDGKAIVLQTSEDMSNTEFTANVKCTGIKVSGMKESYEHEFTGVKFVSNSITLDGKLDDEDWASSTVVTNEDSYSDSNTYQNMKKIYVTNDSKNLYIAVEFGETPAGNKTNINFSFDTSAGTNTAEETGAWMTPATTTNYSNDGLDFSAYECITWGDDSEIATHHTVSNLQSSATYGAWSDACNGYPADSKIVEYKISFDDLAVNSGTVKIFASISQYSYDTANSANKEVLLDCIPSVAASVSAGGESLTVDFSKALLYTIQ